MNESRIPRLSEWLRHQITHDIKGKEPARPPLGIMPRYLAAEERYHALLDAICRNWGEGIEPDPEWIEEAWDMCQHSRRAPHERE